MIIVHKNKTSFVKLCHTIKTSLYLVYIYVLWSWCFKMSIQKKNNLTIFMNIFLVVHHLYIQKQYILYLMICRIELLHNFYILLLRNAILSYYDQRPLGISESTPYRIKIIRPLLSYSTKMRPISLVLHNIYNDIWYWRLRA